MSRGEFLKYIITGIATLSLPGCLSFVRLDKEYDYTDNLLGPLDLTSTIPITNDTTFFVSGHSDVIKSVGSGIIYNNDYVITANHVIDFQGIPTQTPFGTIHRTPDDYDQKLSSNHLELDVIHQYPQYDLALLTNPYPACGSEIITNCPADLGDSDELHNGQIIVSEANAQGLHPFYSRSLVARTSIPSSISKTIPLEKLTNTDFFLGHYSSVPGYSGGGVYAIRDGIPEVVGMHKMASQDGAFGIIHKINSINSILQDYVR